MADSAAYAGVGRTIHPPRTAGSQTIDAHLKFERKMSDKPMIKKRFFGAIGVIFLGALGSGLWELLKPALGWALDGALTISTLGMDSLRDAMYADAHASPIRSEIRAAVTIVCSLVLLTAALLIGYIRVSFRPHQSRLATAYLVMALGFGLAFFAISLRHTYSAGLAAYSAKLEATAAQHLSDQELKKVRAKSVQVDSRSSYLSHVETLRKIAESAGETVQHRDFF